MNLLPQYYYHIKLVKLVDRFLDEGVTSYRKLDEISQELLTATCIEILGNDAYECIIGHEDFATTMKHFVKFLKTASPESSYDLVQTMVKNARETFADDMDTLFSQREDERYSDHMRDSGFTPHIDKVNGEILWMRNP